MQKQQRLKRTVGSNFVRRIVMSSEISYARLARLAAAIFLVGTASVFGAEPGRETLSGHVPGVVAGLTPKGRLTATNNLQLAIGLPLRNEAVLDEFLRQLYDPRSTNFHKFLTPPEFTARFGPTERDYQAVIKFAEANGLTVIGTHGNRVVLDVEGSVSNVEQAFQITLRTYRHPTEARDFFAPDSEPSVPANLRVTGIEGLSDYSLPRRANRRVKAANIRPLSFNGSGPNREYAGNDFRNAYVPGTALNGAGQTVALLEYSDYFRLDITNYENIIGATVGTTNYVPLTNVVVGGFTPGTANNGEVALDIEMAIAMAPKLSRVIVYEKNSVSSSLLNRIATDNLAKQVSSSWLVGAWSSSAATTYDNILKNMAAQGQSYFQSSGDGDAYTGAQPLDSGITVPADSPYGTIVGGTTLTMNSSGGSWSSETVWNYTSVSGYANWGSGGGISSYYTNMPSWQTNVSMANNGGSATNRNIPDVALTADNVFASYNNGDDSGTSYFIGTSCAAPLWAGFCALVNQQSVADNPTNFVGFLNPALYNIAAGTNYNACFHDIITGNNIGTNTAGLFNAVAGYDLCTGLGTPNGTNLINALAPLSLPFFITQPSSQTVTNGASVTFSATVAGQSPLICQWLFNGDYLPAGGNISGTASNVLSITAATTNNSGNYSLIVTNSCGSVTSSVAVLNVGFTPEFSAQPANLTILSGSNAVFSATVSGSTPLVDQWRKNGTNLVNGTHVSGATSNVLTLTAITTNGSGNYNLSVTNSFGAITSSVATLTVVLPPTITSSTVTNRTVQCGSNNVTFAVIASGTPPLNIQWSLDGSPVTGATNTGFSLTNLHLPHTITVTVTNLYASATSNAVVTVLDTLAPVITLNGGNPIYLELGGAFTDPGATANDTCAGVVPVSVSGGVNTNAPGTNALIYTATDGGGNTNSASRTVIVRDTTPPAILWSFTNLTLVADTNCGAMMPDVTGTNCLLATDLSGALTISQVPTNAAILPLGTNVVVLTIEDSSGNAACSTNTVIVQDQTPPVILSQPQSQTNLIGSTATFSVSATACTPLAFQWYFNNAALDAQTNNTLTFTNVSLASAGSCFIVVAASGGSSTSIVAALTVNLLSSTVALASSENPSGFKDNVNFTAAITPANASGNAQFFTNGVIFDAEPVVAGAAVSTNLSSLPRGTNFITAVYSGDAGHLPATNSLTQVVTNHPPVAAPVFYTNTASFTLNISIADLSTNWSDADGDAVSLADVSVSTNGITLTNTGAALVYFNSNNVADQFTCTITDGFGSANFQTVTIEPAPPNTTPLITGIVVAGNGSVSLSLGGAPGYSYTLETTTNLILPDSWQPVATNTFGTNGVWQVTDMEATNFMHRFYRLKLTP
jgi:kumamolisin